jgi:hypothetical protein
MKNVNPRWVIYGIVLMLAFVFLAWASGQTV